MPDKFDDLLNNLFIFIKPIFVILFCKIMFMYLFVYYNFNLVRYEAFKKLNIIYFLKLHELFRFFNDTIIKS